MHVLLRAACGCTAYTCTAYACTGHLQGYRGLIASQDLLPGEVVVSVPLHNVLQVPRQLCGASAEAAVTATAAALTEWQQHHRPLPNPLLDLIMGRWELFKPAIHCYAMLCYHHICRATIT